MNAHTCRGQRIMLLFGDKPNRKDGEGMSESTKTAGSMRLNGWMLRPTGREGWTFSEPEDAKLMRAVIADLVDAGRGFTIMPSWAEDILTGKECSDD